METDQTKAADLPNPPDKLEGTIVVLLFLLSVGCYLNTLMNAFVYDDELQILKNPYVKSWHYLPQIFRTTVWSFIGSAGDTNYYRPLMTMTYLALWNVFGDSPVGYHLFNILLNALVVTCVYYVGRNLFKNQWPALVAAILFAVHPVHTETVSWIAAVPDLEATLLCLLGFHVYLNSPEIPWKRQILIVICFLLALLAKEPALMLAPLLVYYEHFARESRLETTFPSKAKRYLPVCLAALGYLVLRVALLGKLAPVLQHSQLTWPQTIYSAFALITEYARLLFWPTKLSAFHVFHASDSFGEPVVLLGVGIVIITLILASVLYKRFPAAAFCIVWIGVTLAPVLNARWMAGNVLTERYLYLPSVGFCWLVGWAVKTAWDLVEAKSGAKLPIRATLSAIGIALVLLAVTSTWSRNRVWRNDLTLYTKTLQTDPDSHIMHMNLGVTYYESGDFAAAEREIRRAVDLKPDSTNDLNALGCVYLEQGRLIEARDALQRAITLKPQWTDPHFNYGRLLKKMGQDDDALAEFQKAVELGPLNATARFYLAQEFAERAMYDEAAAQYQESIRLSPSLTAQRNLADILLKTGKESQAADILHRMAKDYPFDSATHLRLARLLEKEGKTGEARKEYQTTLLTDPANGEAQDALKRIESFDKE